MNYVNYFKHSLFAPDTYHRRFENDLPEEESMAKRVALVALPFLSLYRPIGSVLSVGMGGARIITHVQGALSAEQKKAWMQMSKELVHTTLASISLASTLFNFSLGTLITTTVDTAQGTVSLLQHLYQGEYSKATEEALQTVAGSFYLLFMINGGLEYMLAFCLVQALLSVVQARAEFAQGRYLEAGAKIIWAGFRLNQAHQYQQAIERRNFLMSMAKYRALIERANKGRSVRHLIEHPLNDLQGQANGKKAILTDAEGNEHDFGAHFHGFGKQLVKGDNLTIRTKIIDGKEIIEFDFKVNHAFRDKLQKTMADLKGFNTKEAAEILKLTNSHVEQIKFEKGEYFNMESWFVSGNLGETQKINLVGLGSIEIGSNAESPNLYDRVVVHLPSTGTIYDLHEMISFLDLDEALKLSTTEAIDRIKLGHLYRIFFPRDATPFERTEEYFALSFDQLKEKMFVNSPAMKEIYDHYFSNMKPYEILPGKIRYQVTGLSEKARELGARAVTAAVTGAYEDKELFNRVASILKMGIISTETRYENDFGSHGLSPAIDFWAGGADGIYTQMFTEKDIKRQMEVDDLYYKSKIRLLIKLEALETGSYQYLEGMAGTRRVGDNPWFEGSYDERKDIFEYIGDLQKGRHGGHEVIFKERLDPSFLQGLIVEDQETYDDFLQYLRSRNMIQKDADGCETILNVAVDQFIRIGTEVTEKLLA